MTDSTSSKGLPYEMLYPELLPIHYPDITLYFGAPRPLNLRPTARYQPTEEIHLVEADRAAFNVDPQDLSNGLMLGLIWGALGKTAKQQSEEIGSAERTVSAQRTMLYRTLGTTSMYGSVRVAFEENIFYPEPARDHAELKVTDGELKVLSAISKERDYMSAAKSLGLTKSTVHTHTQNIFARNSLRNAAHALMLTHLSGQLPIE